MPRTTSVVLIVGLMLFALANPAKAYIVYDGDVTPDVIFGTGNGNGFWTIDRQDDTGIEVGLRGKVRWQGIYNSGGNGTYAFDPGISSGSAALWNYEFAVNTNWNGSGVTLEDVDILLSIDLDPTLGNTWGTTTFNPFDVWTDNSCGDNSTTNGGGIVTDDPGVWGQLNVVQNSQNLGWVPPPLTFDPYADGTYDFRLQVLDSGGLLAETFMTVQVGAGAPIPEPTTIALLGLGIGGFALIRLRKRS